MLNAKGYMAYSFDTKDFKGKQFEPVIMEYVKGEEAKDYLGFNFTFPLGEKLVIGFAPSSNFCGEKVINPDLSSDIIKSIPHFYVLCPWYQDYLKQVIYNWVMPRPSLWYH